MRNQSAPPPNITHVAADGDPSAKRARTARKTDASRADSIPIWLHDAAAAFVNVTPSLSWTGGFYSWGTWLDELRQPELWIRSAQQANPPWRALVDACRASGQVCGTAAIYRAKSDLVSVIISLVYRRGEQQRLADESQQPAAERDVMRRVRAVVTRQRRHEAQSLTLIRFLDLAFVFSAYKDCRLAHAAPEARLSADLQVEQELIMFDGKPTACDLRSTTMRMQTFMWQHRWLPWYEQIPGVRDEMVIRTREAALAFCDGLSYPQLNVCAGVRGLSRDHIAGVGSMNDWLISLFQPRLIPKWFLLAEVYELAVRESRSEEEPLLEETARRVVERVLEPLTEVNETTDSAHSKLIDAAPGIVVTQSVRIEGRFTFRQVLELYIHLAMLGTYLHSRFYGCTLPSIEQIQSGIVLFEETKRRLLEVRPLVEADRVDKLYEWCLATTEAHSREEHASLAAYGGCIAYQHAAIRAALGPSVMLLPSRKKTGPLEEMPVSDYDPLVFAAIIAEWDPPLAARIVDASVRIGRSLRNKFQNGKGGGLDLYTHRRVIVCDAALDRFHRNRKMAARIMSRLHPVWDECESDKGVGVFDGRGAMFLKMAVDKGNFEAASVFGLLLCSDEWQERRQACNLEQDMEAGLAHICKAIAMGDTAAAADLLHLLQMCVLGNSTGEQQHGGHGGNVISKDIVMDCLKCLKDSAKHEPSLSLFLGYLYSQGAPGLSADCQLAIKEYEKVLLSNSTTTRYRAFAANNIGVLKSLLYMDDRNSGGSGISNGSGTSLGEEMKANDYFKVATTAGVTKASSNLAAVLCHTTRDGDSDIAAAAEMYGQIFYSPVGDSPITVIQTDNRRGQMHFFEVDVRRDRQMSFCRDLSPEGMVLEQYGQILKWESLPFVVSFPRTNSTAAEVRSE